MRKLLAFAVAALFLAVSGSAFAADQATCPEGTALRLIGRVKTGGTAFGETGVIGGTGGTGPTVTTAGVKVRRIVGRCGGTACVVGVVDADTVGEATATDYKIEVGAPANTVFDLEFESGLQFDNGLSVSEVTTNTQNIAFYECR